MDTPALAQLLERSHEPLLLVARSGAILWSNPAAAHLLPPPAPDSSPAHLDHLLAPADATRVLRSELLDCLTLSMRAPSGDLRLSLIVLEITSGVYDEQHLLILCSSVPPALAVQHASAEVLATVAHDLKNPIGAIFGYADTLLDTSLGEGLTAKQREVVERLRSTASRSIELIRNHQFLLSAALAPQLVRHARSDLNAAIRSVVEYSWRESGPPLQVVLANEPLLGRIDRLQLERVLANLLTNALTYTPRGGSVSLRTTREGTWAVITIHNTGSWISAEEQATIFQMHTRGKSSTGTSGSGLGLYIVRSTVEAVGGTVSLESNESHGTTFTVRLPLAGGT